MQSLPRSSETAEQRPISEPTRSHRRRITETPNETAARLSAWRDRDSQRRRAGDYFEVEGRYFPQA